MTAQLPVDRLVPHPLNIRRSIGDVTDLAASIRSVGMLQALTVVEAPAKPGTYIVIAGHRRLAAARLLGLRDVPCTIRRDAVGIEAQITLMIIENVQRTDLGAIEKAEALQLLRDRGITLAQIAKRVGLSESRVSQILSLNDLAAETREHVREGRVGIEQAIAAVRATRREQRRTAGHGQTGRPATVEPDHLSRRHPLARAVLAMCTHTRRRKIGQTGCGQCWEAAIRADAGDGPARGVDEDPGDVDEVAVQRAALGEPISLNAPEFDAAVRLLNGRGCSDSAIADRLHTNERRVIRRRSALGVPAVPQDEQTQARTA